MLLLQFADATGMPRGYLLGAAAGTGLYVSDAALDSGDLTAARQAREAAAELADGTRDLMLSA